jgi:methionyl-tRNA formyltransferase
MRAVVFAYSNVGDRCLRVLAAAGVDVPLVVTHPDAPGERLWYARVADTATELGLSVRYLVDPGDPANPALHTEVAALAPDFIFSFYCRNMLPPALLALARCGAFNMHGSLLPAFRGRAPTNWAVLKGASVTGATLHEMAAKPDAGAIIDQQAVPILPDDTARQVFDKVCVAAELVLWRSLPGLLDGSAPRRPNPPDQGSYFSGRRAEDGRIHFSRPAAEIYNLVRAVAPPYPGAFADIGGRRFFLAAARRAPDAARTSDATPGLYRLGNQVRVLGGDGRQLRVLELLLDNEPATPEQIRLLLPEFPTSQAPR